MLAARSLHISSPSSADGQRNAQSKSWTRTMVRVPPLLSRPSLMLCFAAAAMAGSRKTTARSELLGVFTPLYQESVGASAWQAKPM
jgi:hypothetical protein